MANHGNPTRKGGVLTTTTTTTTTTIKAKAKAKARSTLLYFIDRRPF
jgi:hypothetical protein